jgi:hypothetical protein
MIAARMSGSFSVVVAITTGSHLTTQVCRTRLPWVLRVAAVLKGCSRQPQRVLYESGSSPLKMMLLQVTPPSAF